MNVEFFGAGVREGTIRSGRLLLRDVVLLFLHNFHYQVASVKDGDMLVQFLSEAYSEVSGLTCTFFPSAHF